MAAQADGAVPPPAVGATVQLHGLKTAALNGAVGRVTGPPTADGRLPIQLLSPDAWGEFPDGVKVRAANTRPHDAAADEQLRAAARAASRAPPAGASPALARDAWMNGLDEEKQRAWLVDCYRLRVDDDYALGGQFHGLYAEATPTGLVQDFLVFCKLAVARGVVPRAWAWAPFLKVAAAELLYSIEKSDAVDKWGMENVSPVFAAMGGRSLRLTAEFVYGTPAPAGEAPSWRGAKGAEAAARTAEAQLLRKPALFEDVGGMAIWRQLRDALVRQDEEDSGDDGFDVREGDEEEEEAAAAGEGEQEARSPVPSACVRGCCCAPERRSCR